MAPATKQICLGDAAYDLNKNNIHLMTVTTGHCGGGGDESEPGAGQFCQCLGAMLPP